MKHAWAVDAFDTRIFGFSIAKITHIPFEKNESAAVNSVKELTRDLLKKKIRYASYRLKANEFTMIHALEKSGFVLVDGLIAFERMIDSGENILPPSFRYATKNDSKELQKLSGDSCILNRFYHDKVFKNYKKKIHSFYAEWVDNSITGKVADAVLVCEEGGSIAGFISLQKSGHIPLVAVEKSLRGRGISRKMIEASFEVFRQWKVKTVKIEAVMTNIAALRSYEACGFRACDTYLTYRWSQDD